MIDFRRLTRTFIIAEIGVNHEGDCGRAADLIRKAAEAGADAVKFQTFRVENYISTVQPERRIRTKGFELSYEQFEALAGVAKEHGVIFMSTPFHMSDADALEPMVPIFKISSGDLTFLALIRHVASKRKPMIISTGLGTEEEIRAAVDSVINVWPSCVDEGKLLLMHCVSAYPTPAEEANLRNIGWLKNRFSVPVGYSDHTMGTKACELAVAVGAIALEKHFTYQKEEQSFHDHLLSADPEDLRRLIVDVRQAEVYLGSYERVATEAETKLELHMRRSVGAFVDIPAGKPIRPEWLTYLRPQWGLSPEVFDDVIGHRLSRAVSAGDLIRKEDLRDE